MDGAIPLTPALALFHLCGKDYLLTEGELRDASRLPTWRRPNPHGSTYSDMLLYMRSQVEQFAREKWGSLDNIDRECQLRSEKKAKAKRDKRTRKISGKFPFASCPALFPRCVFYSRRKFKCIAELRRRTRISTGKFAPAPDSHMHTFECVSYDPGTSESVRRCTGCGLIQSMEKI